MEANSSLPLNGSEVLFYDSTTFIVLWILSVVVLSITFVLGVLGNELVIWVAGFRMAHTVTTICYLNLALGDFSFMATLPILIISMVMKGKWLFVRDPRGEVPCTFKFESVVANPEEQLKVSIIVNTAIGIISFIIGFSLPMSFIAICYGLMAVKICRKDFLNSSHPLRVLTAVAVSFFMCWFPFQLIILLCNIWNKETPNSIHMLVKSASTLASFNSCLNPILYIFRGQEFREKLIHSLSSSLEMALREDSVLSSGKSSNISSCPADSEL